MKKLKIVILVCGIAFIGAQKVNATNHVIQAGGFSFTPSSLSVTVGDTITWMWISGTHTTTSTQVPSGALTWGAPLDVSDTFFVYKITTAGQYNYECTFHVAMGMTGTFHANPIGIKPISEIIPEKFKLYQNYPNPFNPSTIIKFDIASNTQVKLSVFNMIGSEMAVLVNENLQPGAYSVDWNASKYSSGTYFYKLETPTFQETKRLILVK
jgi:plastocyanin